LGPSNDYLFWGTLIFNLKDEAISGKPEEFLNGTVDRNLTDIYSFMIFSMWWRYFYFQINNFFKMSGKWRDIQNNEGNYADE